MNGFEINISESDFKAKSQDDQSWILFQGIVSANRCIAEIENEGCEFAKRRHKYNFLKILSAISGSVAFAIGIIYIIYQIVCNK